MDSYVQILCIFQKCKHLRYQSRTQESYNLYFLSFAEFKKPFKNSSRPAKAPGAPPESALSKACGAGDLEAIKLILNTVPTSHAAKIDAIFAAGLLNRFEALKYLLLLFKEKNPAR